MFIMERAMQLSQAPGTIINPVECPLISWQGLIECRACGSSAFNFDVGDITRTRRNWVPGRCDDCGFTQGKIKKQRR